ncbi:hypothetical protein [Donghicola mangrovi]|uniref:Uncharacterized protein n=1 Tax=Donghicola mangrovi TaxID=2729614 RepID=A0A850QFN0_9RHOB|nr:hypothetical protein [Donghicola mangrovi]NVO25748.1 hypothetical protein [Donghicola mangrovi]
MDQEDCTQNNQFAYDDYEITGPALSEPPTKEEIQALIGLMIVLSAQGLSYEALSGLLQDKLCPEGLISSILSEANVSRYPGDDGPS